MPDDSAVQTKARNGVKSALSLIAKIVISLGLLAVLAATVDIGRAARLMGPLLDGVGLVAIGLVVIQFWVGGLRWYLISVPLGGSLGLGLHVRYLLISNFFGQALPSTIGADAVRVVLASWRGVPVGTAVIAVLLDRLIALAGLLFLFAAFFPWLLQILGARSLALAPVAALMAAVLLVGVVGVVVLGRYRHRLQRWRMTGKLGELAARTLALARAPQYPLAALVISVALHLSTGLLVWILARSLGTDVAFVPLMVVVIPVVLLLVLPLSIAGWGLREMSMVVGLSQIGVPGDAALAISLSWGLVSLCGSLVGGLVLFNTAIGGGGGDQVTLHRLWRWRGRPQ